MQPVQQRSAAQAVQLLILEAIKGGSSRLNELAAEALVAIGQAVVPTLVAEILTSRSGRYRVRLLEVIARIGDVRDPADYLRLFELGRNANNRIREAAARTIMALQRHRQVIPVVVTPAAQEQPVPRALDQSRSPAHAVPGDKLGSFERASPSQPPTPEGSSLGQPSKDAQRAPEAV